MLSRRFPCVLWLIVCACVRVCLGDFRRSNFSQDRLDSCLKTTEFKSCLFALCFFHAIVLGRRRFGTQGWSRPYSFNTGDLVICSNVRPPPPSPSFLLMFLETYELRVPCRCWSRT